MLEDLKEKPSSTKSVGVLNFRRSFRNDWSNSIAAAVRGG